MRYGANGNQSSKQRRTVAVTNGTIFSIVIDIFSFTALVINEVTKAVAVKIETTQGSKILCMKFTSKHWLCPYTFVSDHAAC
jgi:hypothetical protein